MLDTKVIKETETLAFYDMVSIEPFDNLFRSKKTLRSVKFST